MRVTGKATREPGALGRRSFYRYFDRREAADQDVSFVLQVNPPGEGTTDGTHDLEQWFFVHKGRVRFVVAGEAVIAGPGDLVYVPRNAVHRHEELGDEPAELLVVDHWPHDSENELGWD
jgi:mannose-6-phosphate isomerase-like protein (cupin superfamily)